jgi:hypothetical protein
VVEMPGVGETRELIGTTVGPINWI